MASLPYPHRPDDPPVPPGGWRSGTTRLRVRWRWLEGLRFDGGGRLQARCGWDRTVRTWDPFTGEALGVASWAETDPWPEGVRPDGGSATRRDALGACSVGGREVVVVDVDARRVLRRMALPEHHSPRLRFLDDGSLAALQQRHLLRWDEEGRLIASAEPPDGAIELLPDGDLVCLREGHWVRCDPGGRVRWSVAHRGWTWPHSPDGRWWAWAEGDGVVVLDLSVGTGPRRVPLGRRCPGMLTVSGDGALLAVGEFMEPALEVYDVASGRRVDAPGGPESHVRRLVAAPAGPVSIDARGTLRRHDPATGAVLAVSRGRWWDVMPDGRRLIATTEDGRLGVLDAHTLAGEAGGDGVAVRLLGRSSDGVWVAGHRDALFPVPQQPAVIERRKLDGRVRTRREVGGGSAWVDASRARHGVAALVLDRELALVDARTGGVRLQAPWQVPEEGWSLTAAVAVTEDGTWLVGAYDGRVGVLRPRAKALEARLGLDAPSPASALCPLGGGRVAVGYEHGQVRVWDLATGTLVREWDLHLGPVRALIRWGHQLVSGGDDTTVVSVPLP